MGPLCPCPNSKKPMKGGLEAVKKKTLMPLRAAVKTSSVNIYLVMTAGAD
ncbi:unnamed protein product [Staurois parvus]|uniref:Uncharacterized protein n=1 Tax=Staurois parvus TaxID=386267 RepID=A0ABN9G378_9NEOB|nr:unnamed protein product [Staurois parvus]